MKPVFSILLFIAGFLGWSGHCNAQTEVRYIHTDALGSVVAITDANRNQVERREYEPYGAQMTPSVKDGPGYTGHVQDAATGLVSMQQRYYDAGIGRFLSVDPVTALSDPATQFNRFKYASNNPYKFTDPDGRLICDRNMMGGCNRVSSPSGSCQFCLDRVAANNPSSVDDSMVANGANITVDATDVGLAAHSLLMPKKVGDWVQGDMGMHRWEGASRAEVQRVRSVAKVGNVVSYLTIGLSTYDLQQALREKNGFGVLNSAVDLGFGLYGLSSPYGAAAATAYGGMSLLLEIPFVYDHTVTPIVDSLCRMSSEC